MPYQWSEAQQAYFYPSGRRVPQGRLNLAVDRVLTQAGQEMSALAAQLQAGALSLADWQVAMASEVKSLHLGAAAVARGGWEQMTQSDFGWTGQRIRTQYAYLRNFAHEIATGQQPLDGRLLSRSTLYAEAARGTHREMQRKTAISIGREQESNVLGAVERSCAQCPELSGYGWVPIGTLPPVGSRECRSRCHCTILTRMHPAA